MEKSTHREIYSKINGLVHVYRNKVDIFKYKDAKYKLLVTLDKMRAYLILKPALGKGSKLDANKILSEIKKRRISYKLDNDKIINLIENCNKSSDTKATKHLLCEGTFPENGTDGYGEFIIPLPNTTKLKVTPSKSLNYDFQSNIIEVKEGTEIFKIHLPTQKGEDGYNVLNSVIKAKDGIAIDIDEGMNTRKELEDDAIKIIADTDGYIKYSEQDRCFSVNGIVSLDIAAYTEDILETDDDVIVDGDIDKNITFNIGGDLIVKGSISNGIYDIDGNLYCKKKIENNKKSVITVKGDVEALEITDSKIKSNGEVRCRNSMTNSNIISGSNIICGTESGNICTGEYHAKQVIKAHSIGNSKHEKTVLTIGFDFNIIEKQHSIKLQKKHLQNQYHTAGNVITNLYKKCPELKNFTSKMSSIFEKATKAKKIIKAKLKSLDEEGEFIHEQFNQRTYAEITVYGSIYRNVEMKFGGKCYLTANTEKNVSFIRKAGAVNIIKKRIE